MVGQSTEMPFVCCTISFLRLSRGGGICSSRLTYFFLISLVKQLSNLIKISLKNLSKSHPHGRIVVYYILSPPQHVIWSDHSDSLRWIINNTKNVNLFPKSLSPHTYLPTLTDGVTSLSPDCVQRSVHVLLFKLISQKNVSHWLND